MKKIIALLMTLILVFGVYAYASERNVQVIKENKNHVLVLETLNYYEPISVEKVNNGYELRVFNKLFEYGEVNLTINELDAEKYDFDEKNQDLENVGKARIIFDKKTNIDIIKVKLESSKKYIYEIKTYLNDNSYISHYGTIDVNDTSVETKLLDISEINEPTINDGKIVALSSTVWESESNNSFSSADNIQDDDDVYGYINPMYDYDYYKITFSEIGKANFYLGSIPSGLDYDLFVYDNNYNLIATSANGSNTSELISGEPVAASTYYVKVDGYVGSYSSSDSYLLRVKNYPSYTWPTESERVTYCFACPNYPTHKGIDIGAVTPGVSGDDVYSFADGVVKRYEESSSAYAFCCYINHSNPNPSGEDYLQTRYAHMKDFATDGVTNWSVSTSISKGNIVGLMSNTENDPNITNMGVHLHFETREATSEPDITNGTSDPIDPLANYFPDINCAHESQSLAIQSNETEYIVSNGILINGTKLIELEHLKNMSIEEYEKYGITKEDLNQFIKMFELEETYSKTLDILKIKAEQLN